MTSVENAVNGEGVELLDLEPQPTLIIRTTIKIDDLPSAFGDRVSTMAELLRRREIRPAASPFVRYFTFGEGETDFEFGVPVAAPVNGEGQVAAGELPGGPAVSTWHLGPHERLGEAYARIADWLKANGREASGPSWEVYPWLDLDRYGGPSSLADASTWRTQLVQPIAAERA